jgi:hypothetical protein
VEIPVVITEDGVGNSGSNPIVGGLGQNGIVKIGKVQLVEIFNARAYSNVRICVLPLVKTVTVVGVATLACIAMSEIQQVRVKYPNGPQPYE